jgi:alpha-L-fucosidase 2
MKARRLMNRHSLCRDVACSVSTGLLIALFFAPPPAAAADLTLRYAEPAKQWTEALPIGNGRIGGMVFGGITNERVQFNEQTLWLGDEIAMGSYQPFGDLFIDLHHGSATGYQRALDLQSAVHEVRYTADGVAYRREAWVSFPDRVLVVRLTADKPGALSGALRLTDQHKAAIKATGAEIAAVGRLTNGLDYEAQVRVQHEGGTLAVVSNALAFRGADALTVLLAAGTAFAGDPMKNWRGPHPHATVTRQLNAAAGKAVDALRAAHVADHRALFDRVALQLGPPRDDLRPTDTRLAAYQKGGSDPGLESLLFQYGRYLLIGSSRPGGLPANLQGIWNADLKPAWYSGYTCNINLQMNYWLAELTGLSELHEPVFDWVRNMAVVYKRTQDERVKSPGRGWSNYSTTNPMGGTSRWGVHRPNSAWLAQHFWLRYAFTGDEKFLREVAYPVLKDIVGFWEDRLVEGPGGTLITPDGWSPEHGPVKKGDKIVLAEGDRTPHPGVSYDQQIVWDLFQNYVEAAAVLGVDAEYAAKVAAMRDRLLGPKVGRWGQLQEWMEDVDDPKDTHRHTSHLFALHPGRQISPLTTPEWAKAAKVTLNARGDVSTGWSTAWKINFWARLHDGDRAHKLVRQLFVKCILGNLFDSHPPFQIDGNFGYTSGVTEMLLQSHLGSSAFSVQGSGGPEHRTLNTEPILLHLLPALPAAWPEGRVTGLRARGGFVVDMEWRGGQLRTATIRSLLGRPARVRCGTEERDLRVPAGQTFTWESKS